MARASHIRRALVLLGPGIEARSGEDWKEASKGLEERKRGREGEREREREKERKRKERKKGYRIMVF